MSQDPLPPDWSDIRQADVLKVAVDDSLARAFGLASGSVEDLAVVSQTCDIVQPDREYVTLARIDTPAESALPFAIRGAIPRWVAIPLMVDRFIDLHRILSVSKSDLRVVGRAPGVAVGDWEGERRLSQAIGRNFSRFAFPDDVVPWLDPVRRQLADKAPRESSPVGRVLQDVVEVRLAATDWRKRPLEVTIYLIVVVGRIGEPAGPPSAQLMNWLLEDRPLPEIAARLRPPDGSRPSGADEAALFAAFADALAALCSRAGLGSQDPEVRASVESVSTEVRSEDEFGLDLYRRSERFDVDYLSKPTLSA